MGKLVQFRLTEIEAGQVLDGLEMRAEAYEKTATYLSGGGETGEHFILEEVSDTEEARKIAEFYRKIIASMKSQLKQV